PAHSSSRIQGLSPAPVTDTLRFCIIHPRKQRGRKAEPASPIPRPTGKKERSVLVFLSLVFGGHRSLVGAREGIRLTAAARGAKPAATMTERRTPSHGTPGLALDLAALLGLGLFGFTIDIAVLRVFHVLLLQVLFGLIVAALGVTRCGATRSSVSAHVFLNLRMSPVGVT